MIPRFRRLSSHSTLVPTLGLRNLSNAEAGRKLPSDNRTFRDFVRTSARQDDDTLTLPTQSASPSFYIKTYGCQMNVNDTDIVRSIMLKEGFQHANDETSADIILTNTCAIRENAETKVWHRLRDLRGRFAKRKIVGVLGCMAERLQEDLLRDGLSDLVVGPDAYRDLPRLVWDIMENEDIDQAVNVQLSIDETYEDILPVRHVEGKMNSHSAFVSIQRGCSNRCSFCIVPFTRGQERSRPMQSILDEVQIMIEEQNLREVTLLGQNVNSYHDKSDNAIKAMPSSRYALSNDGFRSRIRRDDAGYFFADLLAAVADLSPELRVRFTSPHPKDYPPELLSLMAERHNICNHLHMPAQSGSTSMLKRMKRGYTREAYMNLIDSVKATIPDVAISSDFIAGFCGETEEEHRDTISLLEYVRYDQAFMFAYSLREKTHAHRVMEDNIPEEIKQERLREIIDTFHRCVHAKNEEDEVDKIRLVLLEGESKRSKPGDVQWHGRTDQNKRVVFPVNENLECFVDDDVARGYTQSPRGKLERGQYAVVRITEAKGHTLRGSLLYQTTAQNFSQIGLISGATDNIGTSSVRRPAEAQGISAR